MANRIGCSAGKTSLIDPNNFSGQGSFDNISVPLEDLNISVQLKTFKKGRTILAAEGESKNVDSSKTVSVTFIEGSNVGGKKVLTTKYTDLTTVLDKGVGDSENLGITNIEVDFNSSFAPLITIQFIDVRGSSIFQNETELNNKENKYSVFFQLPYPLYELTIKGYYGQPVKYCLHMTKFNSKFNSKTGNFEITANFIGYTYAMLSDMLLGILKVIPYTARGAAKYDELIKQNPKLLNLNDLMIEISQLDSKLKKIGGNDPNAAKVNTLKQILGDLDSIKGQIERFGSDIDAIPDRNGYEPYRYIVSTDYEGEKTSKDTYIGGVTSIIDSYNKKATPLGFALNLTDFTTLDRNAYLFKSLNDTTTPKLSDVSDRVGIIGDTITFFVYNMNKQYNTINTVGQSITLEIGKAENELAISIGKVLKEGLGFESTVRNIVECFTVAVEVLLSVIYDVSVEAEENKTRKEELKTAFNNPKNSDKKAKVSEKFYPWPDYREKVQNEGYKEKYLGSYGVLKTPSNVTELAFIDDLLNAFVKAKKAENDAALNLNVENSVWLPVNAFDTILFDKVSPYSRLPSNATNIDVIRLIVIRAMTFLGYTNDKTVLSNNDSAAIIAMATAEANAIINDKNLKQDVKKAVIESFKNQADNVFAGVVSVEGIAKDISKTPTTPETMKVLSGEYTYDYIFNDTVVTTPILDKAGFIIGYTYTDNQRRIIPITESFQLGNWSRNITDLKKISAGGNVFLTNYGSGYKGNLSGEIIKPDDGGSYVKILTMSKYNEYKDRKLSENNIAIENIFKITDLTKGTGYNVFGGIYGIQEFVNMDYEDTSLVNLPLRFVFYSNTNLNKDEKNQNSNSLSYNRAYSKLDLLPIDIDYPNLTASLADSDTELKKVKINGADVNIHDGYGFNRKFFNSTSNGDTNITYPYIENRFRLKQASVLGIINPKETNISLFGSKFYYNNGNPAKALLFLNTLPFNGETFEKPEIINMFNKVGGFIHAPTLWCAYIGGLLWRADNIDPTTKKWKDVIRWDLSYTNDKGEIETIYYEAATDEAERVETFKLIGAKYDGYPNGPGSFSDCLLYMPEQARNEFKIIFFEFCNGNIWANIKNGLEIFKDGVECRKFIDEFYESSFKKNDNKTVSANIINKNLYNNLLNTEKYNSILPVQYFYRKNFLNLTSYNDALFLELKGDYESNTAIRAIINAMKEESIIVNSGPNIWKEKPTKSGEDIYVDTTTTKETLNTYLKAIKDVFKNKPLEEDIKSKTKQEVFGTDSDEFIKFQLYRNCKNIYDKWIGGAKDGKNIMFQCGSFDEKPEPTRNGKDIKLAKEYRNTITPKLIDSFRFVTRSFKDIGSDFYVDPTPIGTYLKENPNSSFYDCVTNLLASNNFDFIALPSFINYNDREVMESLFEPYSYKDSIENGICGPSFVCVYVGQKSKHLDFNGSDYENDGFDVQCGKDGNLLGLPGDFAEESKDYENNVAVFKVAYSQQNQNIFKDIILDQSEFTETEESLKIIDDISKTGSENQRHFGGQNLYSVYGVRSYKAQVEMMGNAMIQPMMYFQLDNIPMFHGAYMITHVTHSIKPNSMSTNFTGVRIRNPETPISKASDLYISLLRTIEITATDTTPLGCPPNGGREPDKTSGFGYKTTIEKLLNGTETDANKIASFEGFKTVTSFYDFKTNKLTETGVLALSQGIAEGLGVNTYSCFNPGNLVGGTCGSKKNFQKFETWSGGWEKYETLLKEKTASLGDSPSINYANCHTLETNAVLKAAGVKYNVSGPYNYAGGSPTLRQYINVYAPWGDVPNNPANYIADIAVTMKINGYDINVDEPMSNYIKF